MPQLSTYSGADVTMSLISGPEGLFPPIQAGGISQTGIESITVRPTVEHATIQIAMDGAAVPSWAPGEPADIEIAVYQTSTTHQQFVAAYNAILANSNIGDVSQNFANTLIINVINVGNQRTCTGVAFTKIPDETFQKEAQTVHWILKACNVTNEFQAI